MKKFLLGLLLLCSPVIAFANTQVPATNVPTNCSTWNKNLNCTMTNQQLVDNAIDQLSTGGGSGLTVGTTTITNGTNGYVEYNNNGVLGEKAVSGTGTVTSVSVATANGFSGTVANASTTPAITMQTSITGILKGNGTSISAATSGTDYQPALSLLAGTYTNNDLCVYASSGTLLNCNLAQSTFLTPTGSAASLTSFPTFNQNTTGTAANLSGTPALPNGTTATTQSQADGSTKLATTAYVDTGLGGKQATGSYLTGVTADSPLSGSGTSGSHLVISTAGTWAGNAATATTAGTVTTAAQGNITSVGTLTGLTTGTIIPSAFGTQNLGSTLAPWLALFLSDSSVTYYTKFLGGAQSANITYTLPTAIAGGAGYVLTDAAGNGVLSWAAAGGGAVSSVSNTDGYLTSSPTTGAVVVGVQTQTKAAINITTMDNCGGVM